MAQSQSPEASDERRSQDYVADFNDDLPENNDATLTRLVRVLDYAEGFTLLFARCNFPAVRSQLEDALEQALAARNVRVMRIDLTAPVANIRHLLRDELLAATKKSGRISDNHAKGTTSALTPLPVLHESSMDYETNGTDGEAKLVLFLSGLELSIPYDDPGTPALAQLNLGRDFFPRELPHPLLIWLPDYALTAVARHAPDFWSWRSGLFEFAGTEIERTEALRHHTREEQGWSRTSNLTSDERLARRRLLESLLDDYTHQNASVQQTRELADLYFSLGEICHGQADSASALHYYEQALSLTRTMDDRRSEARILNNIGGVYDELGEKEQALAYYEQTLPLRRSVGDQRGEASTLNNIGGIYYDLGKKERALVNYEQTLTLFRATSDQRGEATTLNNIGMVYSALGEKSRALDNYEQALTLSRAVSDRAGEATTLNNIGVICSALGEKSRALDNYEQALTLRKAVGDRTGEATTLNNISQIFKARGDYETALRYLEQSLAIRQEIGDVAGLCATLFNMGHIHWQNGEQQEAVEAWVTVYRLAKQINLAQALQALTGLAESLGLEGGLTGWEALAQRMAAE